MSVTVKYLCTSANGKRIVFDPVNSHTASHFHDSPSLRNLVLAVLSKITLKGRIIGRDVDMGRVVGKSDVVEVDSRDKIVYAMRKNHAEQGYVPFVKTKTSQPSNFISIYLAAKDDSTYELSSAWIGEFDSPNFPQMQNAEADSIPYWRAHAFVWGSQEVIPGSEISYCPW